MSRGERDATIAQPCLEHERRIETEEKANKPTVKIKLTTGQTAAVRKAIGKEVVELALKPEELEERVAPKFI